MVEWTLNTVANVSTAIAVLAALVFGVIQVRQQERRRREGLVLDALRMMQDPTVSAAVESILHMPEGLRGADIAKASPEFRRDLMQVDYALESIGWMVYRRLVRLHDVDDLVGGVVRISWRKLKGVAEDERRAGHANAFEWLQWLAERMEAHPSPGKAAGAHVSHKAWRP